MNLLKDILLQLFFLFLPTVIYYHLKNRDQHTLSEFKRQIIVFLYCSSSVILCMQFPIEYPEGLSYDLSIIPVIIAILYGGYLSGFLSIIVYLTNYISFGGATSYLPTYLALPILVLLPAILQPKWKELPRKSKYFFAFLMMSLKLPLLYVFFIFQNVIGNPSHDFIGNIVPITLSIIAPILAILLLVYLIEYYFDLDELQKQMKRMRRLQHVSNLAKEVSEEVHKPLTMIKGFTQLLGAEHNKVNKEYVPIILSELDRAEAIIDSYINLAKPDHFPARSLSSKELVENVMDGLKTYAKNNQVSLEELQVRNLRLRGNMELLSESFTSIIKYFIDATHSSNGKVLIKNYLKGNNVIFEIIDVNRKTNSEALELLKNYYFHMESLQNERIQTAFSILFAHNGNLFIKRKLFKGNRVIITLPAYVKKRSPVNPKVVSS
ncbi:ATP-binding protein [Sutcliffiella halmapala]|uniref:ATP-binding protein n=1 Tax=Sutcliffiella halmapala TaxID=79882 RepID=UPI001474C2CA|nr:sensor histidine kinase [Sutcliffiella halmapala]